MHTILMISNSLNIKSITEFELHFVCGVCNWRVYHEFNLWQLINPLFFPIHSETLLKVWLIDCSSHMVEHGYFWMSRQASISSFGLLHPVLLVDLQYLVKQCISSNYGYCSQLRYSLWLRYTQSFNYFTLFIHMFEDIAHWKTLHSCLATQRVLPKNRLWIWDPYHKAPLKAFHNCKQHGQRTIFQ